MLQSKLLYFALQNMLLYNLSVKKTHEGNWDSRRFNSGSALYKQIWIYDR